MICNEIKEFIAFDIRVLRNANNPFIFSYFNDIYQVISYINLI